MVIRNIVPPATAGRGYGDRPPASEALVELETRLLDTIAGYDKILEKAEPEFRPIADAFRTLHLRQAASVGDMLLQDGHPPGRGGSVFGTVNRAIVSLRALVDDISVNIMDPLVQGEKHVLEAYDEAIAEAGDAERQRVLSDDRAALVALLDQHTN